MEQINIFTKGMNRDINPHFQDNGSYYYLENGDILTEEELSSASIMSVLGNAELNIIWPSDVTNPDDAKDPYADVVTINGAIYVRDDIVLMYSPVSPNTTCIIDLLKYNGDNTYIRIRLMEDSLLNFSSVNKMLLNET